VTAARLPGTGVMKNGETIGVRFTYCCEKVNPTPIFGQLPERCSWSFPLVQYVRYKEGSDVSPWLSAPQRPDQQADPS
jgi:hypothetical protein